MVQVAATSLGQRFVKNKQIEGRNPEVGHSLGTRIVASAVAFFFFWVLGLFLFTWPGREQTICSTLSEPQMPGPTQALSPNGENNNDIVQDNGSNIIPYRKNTVRGERAYR